MLRIITFILFISGFCVFGQSKGNTAPIMWEKYQESKENFSILFPKKPNLYNYKTACEETTAKSYAVYAEEAVYQLTVYSKYTKNDDRGDFAFALCKEILPFGKATVERKISNFNKDEAELIRLKIQERPAVKFRSKFTDYLIVDDLKNNKIYVVAVTSRKNDGAKIEEYFKSLELSNKTSGIEIKDGSEITLGDESEVVIEGKNSQEGIAKESENQGIIIVNKPRPNYTDKARMKNLQGTVTLKVVFQSNGAIGDITPIFELPHGLTEQAITAVKKIVFLPQKVNGKNITVTKSVQFSFTLY